MNTVIYSINTINNNEIIELEFDNTRNIINMKSYVVRILRIRSLPIHFVSYTSHNSLHSLKRF